MIFLLSSRPPATSRLNVFEFLRRCAIDCRIVTYEEVADEVGLPAVGIGRQLEAVAEICHQRRLPWLNALVVNKTTRRPGSGFAATLTTGTPRDEDMLWRGVLAQVVAFPSWHRVTVDEG